jgi:hypothetical protein
MHKYFYFFKYDFFFLETWLYAHQTKHFFLYIFEMRRLFYLKKLVESGYFNIRPAFYSVSIQSRY